MLSDGAETVGFFPFERRRFGVGMPIGTGVSNYQGLIHAPAVEWDPQEVLRACRITVWQFDNLVEGQKPFERYATDVASSAGVDLTEGFGTYQQELASEVCKVLQEYASQHTPNTLSTRSVNCGLW